MSVRDNAYCAAAYACSVDGEVLETDEPENSAQVFPVMAGEDVFVDKGNVLKERVLDPFVKTEIKADRIETALLPDSMIVESMKNWWQRKYNERIL